MVLKKMFNLKFNTLIMIILSVLLLFSLTNTVCAQENNTNNMDDVIIQGTYGELEKEINNLEPGETIKLTQNSRYNDNNSNNENEKYNITNFNEGLIKNQKQNHLIQDISNLNNELKKNNNPNNPNILIINDTTLNRLQFSLRILFP